MGFALRQEPSPLRTDADGTVRIGQTRVTLDTVVEAFNEGLTAEEIAQQYPSVELADVYAAISYYLRYRDHVESYLEERGAMAAKLRRKIEARCSPAVFRERLLARQRQLRRG